MVQSKNSDRNPGVMAKFSPMPQLMSAEPTERMQQDCEGNWADSGKRGRERMKKKGDQKGRRNVPSSATKGVDGWMQVVELDKLSLSVLTRRPKIWGKTPA